MTDPSVWDILAQDMDVEHHEALLASASLEAAPIWAFLTQADSEADYTNRLALSEDALHRVAAMCAPQASPDYMDIVASLPPRWFSDWQTLQASKKHGLYKELAPNEGAIGVRVIKHNTPPHALQSGQVVGDTGTGMVKVLWDGGMTSDEHEGDLSPSRLDQNGEVIKPERVFDVNLGHGAWASKTATDGSWTVDPWNMGAETKNWVKTDGSYLMRVTQHLDMGLHATWRVYPAGGGDLLASGEGRDMDDCAAQAQDWVDEKMLAGTTLSAVKTAADTSTSCPRCHTDNVSGKAGYCLNCGYHPDKKGSKTATDDLIWIVDNDGNRVEGFGGYQAEDKVQEALEAYQSDDPNNANGYHIEGDDTSTVYLEPRGGMRQGATRHTAPGGGVHGPYRIQQSGDSYKVVNDRGEVKGTHPSYEEARQQQKALYVNIPEAREQAEEDEKKGSKRSHKGTRNVVPSGSSVSSKQAGQDPLPPTGAADVTTNVAPGWYVVDDNEDPLSGPYATADEAYYQRGNLSLTNPSGSVPLVRHLASTSSKTAGRYRFFFPPRTASPGWYVIDDRGNRLGGPYTDSYQAEQILHSNASKTAGGGSALTVANNAPMMLTSTGAITNTTSSAGNLTWTSTNPTVSYTYIPKWASAEVVYVPTSTHPWLKTADFMNDQQAKGQRCVKCGHVWPGSLEGGTCLNCGGALKTVGSKTADGFSTCPNCGTKKYRLDMRRCMSCGYQGPPKTSARTPDDPWDETNAIDDDDSDDGAYSPARGSGMDADGKSLSSRTAAVPPYEPTWTDASDEELDAGNGAFWAVYDQAEGFQPAWAKVMADDAGDAVDIASEVSGGRIDPDSETVVVTKLSKNSRQGVHSDVRAPRSASTSSWLPRPISTSRRASGRRTAASEQACPKCGSTDTPSDGHMRTCGHCGTSFLDENRDPKTSSRRTAASIDPNQLTKGMLVFIEGVTAARVVAIGADEISNNYAEPELPLSALRGVGLPVLVDIDASQGQWAGDFAGRQVVDASSLQASRDMSAMGSIHPWLRTADDAPAANYGESPNATFDVPPLWDGSDEVDLEDRSTWMEADPQKVSRRIAVSVGDKVTYNSVPTGDVNNPTAVNISGTVESINGATALVREDKNADGSGGSTVRIPVDNLKVQSLRRVRQPLTSTSYRVAPGVESNSGQTEFTERGLRNKLAAETPTNLDPKSNTFPPKNPGAPEGNQPPQTQPGAAPSTPMDPNDPNVDIGTVQVGDAILEPGQGRVDTFVVNNVTDEGQTMLLEVTKNQTENMTLQVPKTERVQVHTTEQKDNPVDPSQDPQAAAAEDPNNPNAQAPANPADETVTPKADDNPMDPSKPPEEHDPTQKPHDQPEGDKGAPPKAAPKADPAPHAHNEYCPPGCADKDPDEPDDDQKKKPPFPPKGSKRSSRISIDPSKLDDKTLGRLMRLAEATDSPDYQRAHGICWACHQPKGSVDENGLCSECSKQARGGDWIDH